MKKIIALLLALLLGITLLAGCGGNTTSEPPSDTEDEQTSAAEESTEDVSEESPDESSEEPAINPADGEPFKGDTFSKMVGTVNLDSEWLSFEEPLVVDDIFNAEIAIAGDSYCVLTDGKAGLYTLKDGKFILDKELDLGEEYDQVCNDKDGNLYFSKFMRDFIAFDKDGKQLFAHSGTEKVFMHPSGEWGLSWFMKPDEVKKVILKDGAISFEDMSFEGPESISHLCISENYIFLTGGLKKEDDKTDHAIFVYDLKGKLKYTLGGGEFGEPDSLGSVTRVIETESGFLALDGNMRNVCLWKSDGTLIGSVKDGDMFGTGYPWMSTAVLASDGSILVGLTEERADKSAKEFIVYKLTGFGSADGTVQV